MSREGAAELKLELNGGRTLDLALDQGGDVRMNGERIGHYERGDALYRSWRALLSKAMEVPDDKLAALLIGWQPPDNAVAQRLDRELESVLESAPVAADASAPAEAAAPTAPADVGKAAAAPADQAQGADSREDSIRLLNERLRALQGAIEDVDPSIDISGSIDPDQLREQIRREIRNKLRAEVHPLARSPFRHVWRGLSGVFSTLIMYAILVGLGFLSVFFGRKYLEGVSDTARKATLRSLLVGLAGSFLVLPAWILGMIALAISIVGIPLLLVWVPLFPVAVCLAAIVGYLAVAHAGGEALAERRFDGGDWFKRANSYYYVMTGVGLLLVLYLAAHIIGMAGPWLGFLRGLLTFFAVVITWAAFSIGFGAVLISRAGTRPLGKRRSGGLDADAEEEPHV
ncbi:MAG TPA: hypothetical protein VJ957_10310 [Longimicrobiales bacterium]|nr:hypothetical protein [Longimicrobiales bacterium]